MDARFNLLGNDVAARFGKYLNSAGAAVTKSALPAATQELVKIRASQVNGCSGCTDMHTKDAEHAGESRVRLNLIAAWRDATVFTDAERAALELTEQGTRIADAAGGVTDEVWANAAKHCYASEGFPSSWLFPGSSVLRILSLCTSRPRRPTR
jgi:AhpD family alkylhydroperoxidase